MPLKFQILGSSSAGNCALLDTGQTRILIDAGFSAGRIQKLLKESGLEWAAIDAVFLTHEHSDHSAALRGLKKRPDLPIFASHGTADVLQGKLQYRPMWKRFESGAPFAFRDIEVTSFRIPHDAVDPVGYVFSAGDDADLFNKRRSVAWVTDLGYVPSLVRERVRAADVLVLESNYDNDLLENCSRPWSLKQRIRGRHGHLSNDSAYEYLTEETQANWKHVYLAHLSRECNDHAMLRERYATGVNRFTLQVVDPDNGVCEMLEL